MMQEKKNHPNNNNKRKDNGTRLRLILSNIFHLDNDESGLRCNFLSAPFTHGNTQLAICQSPLIHL